MLEPTWVLPDAPVKIGELRLLLVVDGRVPEGVLVPTAAPTHDLAPVAATEEL